MGYLWYSIQKDLARRWTDPGALALWMGIPLLIGGLMQFAGGGSGGGPKAHLLVVDADDSFLSTMLVKAAGGAEIVQLETFEEEAAARAKIDSGEASALLLIPEGFGEAVLDREPCELVLVKNPAQQILPGIIEEALEMVVEASFYVQRLFGDDIDTMIAGPPGGAEFFDEVQIAALSISINDRMQRLGTLLFPPVLKLETVRPASESSAGGFDLGRALFPGMLLLSLLFIAMGISDDLWKERDGGTLRRLRAAPGGAWVFLASKVLSGTALVTAIGLVGLLLGSFAFDLPLARVPLALVWCALGGAALLSFFLFLQTLAGSQRGGNMLASMIAFPMMMIGGSFFPFEAMPKWMVFVGSWTPNGMAVQRLSNILGTGALDTSSLARGAGGLLLLIAICATLAHARIRREA